jgi:hypothetical protein
MQSVYIERLRTNERDGTLGVLLIDSQSPWLTLEPPWRNNAKWDGSYDTVSCIPIGEYTCRQLQHRTFGTTWEVQDVPGRSGILFHVGNYRTDTMGCILLAERWSGSALLESRVGLNRFRKCLALTKQFRLLIRGDSATYKYPTAQDGGVA